jgi:hypothetical protein
LLFYGHIIEMSAPYEVLANLLRFRLKKGYSPNPFHDFLTREDRKRGIHTRKKIDIIKKLSAEAGLRVGEIFDEFYSNALRNAIAHSDFIVSEDGVRCRRGNWTGSFHLTFEQADDILTKAKVFIGTFFGLERDARQTWGKYAGRGMAYDPQLKGIMEILVDRERLMNGFKVHWPNGSDSIYRRTADGIDMVNCSLAIKDKTLALFVGMYARNPGPFSLLVENGAEPNYTPLENGIVPTWAP